MYLITGSSGQLGSALMRLYGDSAVIAPSPEELDITDEKKVKEFVKKTRPSVIINCAAYNAVDKAETDVDECMNINYLGNKYLVEAAESVGAYYVYVSTDFVFDGTQAEEYGPYDKVSPLSVYGKSKAMGEEVTLKYNNALVVRTSWLFSELDNNFVHAVIKKAKNAKKISVVDDQVGSPTYATDLAVTIKELVDKRAKGILHATNEGACSRYEFASEIIKVTGCDCEVEGISSDDYESVAQRPQNSVLSKKCLDEIGVKRLPDWRSAVKRCLTNDGERKKPMKILVTGAGGYIGRHVVTALCDMGEEVIAADIRTDGIDDRAKKISSNIFLPNENIFKELGEPDVCVHMAWRDGFVHNSDAHMGDLSSHYTFLKNMITGGLKHLAVMGTMHEIGYYEGAIDENTPCNPISMYGIAKDALRRSTILLCKQNDVCLQWLRAYYIYGDDKRNNSIFAKITVAAEEGKKTFPFTSGKNKYDFIKVDELAKQIACASVQTEVVGIINCCTGKPISLGEKVESFIAEHGFDIKLEYGKFPDRPYDSPAIWGNADKINEILAKRR